MLLSVSCDADCSNEKSSIFVWIEALEPNSPEVPKGYNNRRKRPCGQLDTSTSPPKRRASTGRGKGPPLVPTSGNIMPPRAGKGQTPSQTPKNKRRRSRGKTILLTLEVRMTMHKKT